MHSSLIDLAWGDSGRVPIIVGAILIYGAARLAQASRRFNLRSTGWQALAYFFPIAVAALNAMHHRRSDLAISIIFTTSIAILSLNQGIVLLIAPAAAAPVGFRRMWPFVIPAALMTMMAGFSGRLTVDHACIFGAEGLAVLLAWRQVAPTETVVADSSTPHSSQFALTLWLVAFVGGLGALALAHGAIQMVQPYSLPSADMIVPSLLGPLLVVPMLVGESTVAYESRPWVATTAGVGVVLLNLLLLLPIVIVYGRQIGISPMIFSWVTWRVDNVVLLLLAFVLVPPAMDRWRLGRAEGTTLIGIYIVFALMELVEVSHS